MGHERGRPLLSDAASNSVPLPPQRRVLRSFFRLSPGFLCLYLDVSLFSFIYLFICFFFFKEDRGKKYLLPLSCEIRINIELKKRVV